MAGIDANQGENAQEHSSDTGGYLHALDFEWVPAHGGFATTLHYGGSNGKSVRSRTEYQNSQAHCGREVPPRSIA